MYFGSTKSREYTVILESATKNFRFTDERSRVPVPILGRRVDLNSQTEYLNRLRARVDYYRMVNIGGKVFLAIAGMLLMAALLSMERKGHDDQLLQT